VHDDLGDGDVHDGVHDVDLIHDVPRDRLHILRECLHGVHLDDEADGDVHDDDRGVRYVRGDEDRVRDDLGDDVFART